MKITVVQQALEGLVDDDHSPQLYKGHLTLDQARVVSKDLGQGYPHCSCVPCDDSESAVFYTNFSNDPSPELDEDGTAAFHNRGDLELWFYYSEL